MEKEIKEELGSTELRAPGGHDNSDNRMVPESTVGFV